MSKKTIELKNVGPIEGTFKIELDGPGLYELTGSKGQGKSTVLTALDLLQGQRVTLTVHDGELDGSVEGFGVVAPIGRRKIRGESEVTMLASDRFDLQDLISPDRKTAVGRDEVRIKALASLSGLQLSEDDFTDLIGGEKLDVAPTEDPILYASRVKEHFDSLARSSKRRADSEEDQAKALEGQVAGLDMDGVSDPVVLDAAADAALVGYNNLLSEQKQYDRDFNSATEAKKALDSLTKDNSDPGKELSAAEEAMEAAISKEKRARAALEKAIASTRDAKAALQAAKGKVKEFNQRSVTISHLRLTAHKLDGVSRPSEEDLKKASQELADARQARDQGVRIRDAQQTSVRAQAHRSQADKALLESMEWRERASQVFPVVMKKLNTTHILVKEMSDGATRLVVNHPKRGRTFFDHQNGLSDGERVRVTLDELLPHLGCPGLLPVPQQTYQDLPPQDRRELAEYAEANGVYLFGAQVTDGDLNVQKYT